MIGLIAGAALLAAVALAIFLLPALKRGAGLERVSALSAVFVVIVGVVTYATLGSPELAGRPPVAAAGGPEGEMPASVDEAIAGLIERMQANPEDIEGWVLLGRSLVQTGRFAEAARAFGEARARVPAPDDELDLSYAEARILADQTALAGAPGEIAARLADAEPGNVRAQLYGGLAAMATGADDIARQRFSRILARDDIPDDFRKVVETRMAQLDAGAVAAAPDAPREPTEPAAAASALTVHLALGEGIDPARLAEASALFVFARSPEGGPPVAVQRHTPEALPGTFELSDADAMIPSRRLSNYAEVRVVARLSISGNPVAGPEDVIAEASAAAGPGAEVALTLEHAGPAN